MNDKKERYISSELSDKTQLSVMRSIVGWGYEKIRHSLGRPGQLERAIASGELIPCPLKTPVDTLWTRSVIYWHGFAPIFPDICYHLTHYKPAAADIPVASDNPAHYADAIRYNARTPLQGSLLPLTRLVWA